MDSSYVFDEDLMSLISNFSYIQSNSIYISTRHVNNCFVQTTLRLKKRPHGRITAFFARIGPEGVPLY